MPDCDLHPGFIKPDGIFPSIHLKTFAAFSILTLYKLRVFSRCLFTHKVIDDTQLASCPVSSRP